MAGIHLITIQHLLGHPKITMTARYAHALADAKIEAVEKLEKVSKIGPQTVTRRVWTKGW